MLETCGECLEQYELQDELVTVAVFLLQLEFSFIESTCPKCSVHMRSFVDDLELLEAFCRVSTVTRVRLRAPDHIQLAREEAERRSHEDEVVSEMERQFHSE